MTHDFQTIEALAKRLCHNAGGSWEAKYTKKAHWRKLATAKVDAERGRVAEFFYSWLKGRFAA